MLLSK